MYVVSTSFSATMLNHKAVAVLVLLIFSVTAYAQVAASLGQKVPDVTKLIATVEKQGFVPVIVEFEPPQAGTAPNADREALPRADRRIDPEMEAP